MFQTLFDVSPPLLSVLLLYRAAPWIYTHFFPGCFHVANYANEVFSMMQTVRYNFHQSGLHPATSSSDMQASPFLHLKAQNMVVDLLNSFLLYTSFKCNPGHYSATKKDSKSNHHLGKPQTKPREESLCLEKQKSRKSDSFLPSPEFCS